MKAPGGRATPGAAKAPERTRPEPALPRQAREGVAYGDSWLDSLIATLGSLARNRGPRPPRSDSGRHADVPCRRQTVDTRSVVDQLTAALTEAPGQELHGRTRWHSPERVIEALVSVAPHSLQANGASFALPGQPQAASPPGSARRLRAELRFQGEVFGELVVWRTASGFSQHERAWLRAWADLGALTLAFAQRWADAEQARQFRIAASQSERRVLLDTVGSDVLEQLQLSINFFRSVFAGDRSKPGLEADEWDIGLEEIARMEQIAFHCKNALHRRGARQLLDMEWLVVRALSLVEDGSVAARLQCDLAGERLRAEPFLATHMLARLLTRAMRAAGEGGTVGVSWGPEQGAYALTVWDTAAWDGAELSREFLWAAPDAEHGGLCLAMARRIAKAHGWSMEGGMQEGKTLVSVRVPRADVGPGE